MRRVDRGGETRAGRRTPRSLARGARSNDPHPVQCSTMLRARLLTSEPRDARREGGALRGMPIRHPYAARQAFFAASAHKPTAKALCTFAGFCKKELRVPWPSNAFKRESNVALFENNRSRRYCHEIALFLLTQSYGWLHKRTFV